MTTANLGPGSVTAEELHTKCSELGRNREANGGPAAYFYPPPPRPPCQVDLALGETFMQILDIIKQDQTRWGKTSSQSEN